MFEENHVPAAVTPATLAPSSCETKVVVVVTSPQGDKERSTHVAITSGDQLRSSPRRSSRKRMASAASILAVASGIQNEKKEIKKKRKRKIVVKKVTGKKKGRKKSPGKKKSAARKSPKKAGKNKKRSTPRKSPRKSPAKSMSAAAVSPAAVPGEEGGDGITKIVRLPYAIKGALCSNRLARSKLALAATLERIDR